LLTHNSGTQTGTDTRSHSRRHDTALSCQVWVVHTVGLEPLWRSRTGRW
jgi:hypothetical protein